MNISKILYAFAAVVFLIFARVSHAQHFLMMTDEEKIELTLDKLRKGIQQQDTTKLLMVFGRTVSVNGEKSESNHELAGKFQKIFESTNKRKTRLPAPDVTEQKTPLSGSNLWDFDIISPQISINGDSAVVNCELVLWAGPTIPGSKKVGAREKATLIFTFPKSNILLPLPEGYQPWPAKPLKYMDRSNNRQWVLVGFENLLDFLEAHIVCTDTSKVPDGGGHKMKKNNMKLFALPAISLLVLIGFFNMGCSEDPEQTGVNQDQCDADCFGSYEITSVSASASYICDPSGCFDIEFEVNIDSCYHGLTVQWVELWSESHGVYRTNPIGFFPSGGAKQSELEFGGSIPSGEYYLDGRMIDLQAQCTDGICRNVTKHSDKITVTQCPPPENNMYIEYTYQYDTVWDESYDLRVSSYLSEYINIAFNAADATHELDAYPYLSAELVCDDSIAAYINRNKTTYEYFLCGIKGFMDENGNQLDWLLGKTWYNNSTYKPASNTGCLVSVTAAEAYAGGLYRYTFNEIINYVTIHELGHQCGVDGHCEGNQFCLMNQTPDDYYPDYVSRIWNPHFCVDCIDKIKAVPEW